MSTKIGILPISEPPKSDECLFGYLTRLGSMYGYPNGGWIAQLIGINPEKQSLFAISERLKALATCTGASTEELKRIAVRRAPGKMAVILPSGRTVSSNYISMKTAYVCEECIAEFGYVRMSWILRCIPACPIHQCLLVDRCSNCGSVFNHLRPAVHCWCGHPPPKRHQKVRSHLSKSIEWHQEYWLKNSKRKPKKLDNLPLKYSHSKPDEQMRAIKFLATTFRDRDRCLNQAPNKSIELSSLHFIKAYAILGNWPEGYHSLLETMLPKKQNGEIMLHGALHNHYNTLIEWRHAEVLSPFWDYLNHFLEKRKREQIVTGRGQPLVQKYMSEPAYISQAHAAQHLAISKSKIKTLVENGQLKSKKFETGYGMRSWLCSTSVEEYSLRRWDIFTQNSAAVELGIAKATVVSFLKAKILRHAVSPEHGDITLSQRITGESVRGVAQRLNDIAIARIPGEGDPIPLIKAPDLYNANGISLAVIIKAVLLSRIRIWVTDVRYKPYLHNFEISEQDLRYFARLKS